MVRARMGQKQGAEDPREASRVGRWAPAVKLVGGMGAWRWGYEDEVWGDMLMSHGSMAGVKDPKDTQGGVSSRLLDP